MDSTSYHLDELRVASDPNHRDRLMPPILPGQKRILDVGCGAGQTLIASKLATNVVSVGVDVDHSALKLGKQLNNTVNFACATGEALPIKSDYFDLVFSRVALPYMHIQLALTEMWRVLRAGGTLWMSLHPFSMVARELLNNMSHFEFKAAAHRGYVLTNGLTAHLFGQEFRSPFGARRYESFQTTKMITKMLANIGFADIKTTRDHFFIVTATKPGRVAQPGG
jgi:ubiquinone/menaquinone biosynthesis C-methylase UbiE